MNEGVAIQSRDYWFKVIEMLQQNWVLIESAARRVTFASAAGAETELGRNGFRRFAEDERAESFLHCLEPPFTRRPHPNGPIYSSDRFWVSGPSTNTAT